MNKLQRQAWSMAWCDDKQIRQPPTERYPGGLTVGLSLNY